MASTRPGRRAFSVWISFIASICSTGVPFSTASPSATCRARHDAMKRRSMALPDGQVARRCAASRCAADRRGECQPVLARCDNVAPLRRTHDGRASVSMTASPARAVRNRPILHRARPRCRRDLPGFRHRPGRIRPRICTKTLAGRTAEVTRTALRRFQGLTQSAAACVTSSCAQDDAGGGAQAAAIRRCPASSRREKRSR